MIKCYTISRKFVTYFKGVKASSRTKAPLRGSDAYPSCFQNNRQFGAGLSIIPTSRIVVFKSPCRSPLLANGHMFQLCFLFQDYKQREWFSLYYRSSKSDGLICQRNTYSMISFPSVGKFSSRMISLSKWLR